MYEYIKTGRGDDSSKGGRRSKSVFSTRTCLRGPRQEAHPRAKAHPDMAACKGSADQRATITMTRLDRRRRAKPPASTARTTFHLFLLKHLRLPSSVLDLAILGTSDALPPDRLLLRRRARPWAFRGAYTCVAETVPSRPVVRLRAPASLSAHTRCHACPNSGGQTKKSKAGRRTCASCRYPAPLTSNAHPTIV